MNTNTPIDDSFTFNKQNVAGNNTYQPIINQVSLSGTIKISNNNDNKTNFQDIYCKSYEGEYCIECYSNFHVKFGVCKINNPLCKEMYPNGSCKSCYKGYLLEA